jgi:poly-gamma-glutamate synthesis protein (capsule biosynthesis protein)
MSRDVNPESVGCELKVAAMGDIMAARRISVYKEPEFLELVELIRSSDVGFANLEGLPGNFKGYSYANFDGTPTSSESYMADELKWAGFNLVSIANNHSLDCGPENLFSAMDALDKAAITYAGAGKDLDWAQMPGYLETRRGLVALVASVTGEQGLTYYQQHTRASKPGGGYPGRPGVNGIRHDKYYGVDPETWNELRKLKKKFTEYFQHDEKLELQRIPRDDGTEELLLLGNRFVLDDKISEQWLVNRSDLEANIRRVSDACRLADWVLMSNHSHESVPYSQEGTLPPAHIVKYAHDCIDAGADAYLGHGVHTGQGIEIYKGKPIFYSLATPIYSMRGLRRIPLERYEMLGLGPDSTPAEYFNAREKHLDRTQQTYLKWLQTLLAVFTMRGEKESRKLSELRLYPINSYNSDSGLGVRPVIVKDEQLARRIIDRYEKLSPPFDTKIEFKDGIGVVKL